MYSPYTTLRRTRDTSYSVYYPDGFHGHIEIVEDATESHAIDTLHALPVIFAFDYRNDGTYVRCTTETKYGVKITLVGKHDATRYSTLKAFKQAVRACCLKKVNTLWSLCNSHVPGWFDKDAFLSKYTPFGEALVQ